MPFHGDHTDAFCKLQTRAQHGQESQVTRGSTMAQNR